MPPDWLHFVRLILFYILAQCFELQRGFQWVVRICGIWHLKVDQMMIVKTHQKKRVCCESELQVEPNCI